MPGSAPAGASKRTIQEIKQEILHRARARQALIERGEYDVPLHYTPLPLPQLLDLLGQLEYRRDFLSLAVPPPHPALGQRLGRGIKNAVCTLFRWLLIRQVEYNTAAITLLQQTCELLDRIDRNQNEFAAALTALKLQMHAQARRLGQLEHLPAPAGAAAAFTEEEAADRGSAYQSYLSYLRGPNAVLVIGCGQPELVKLLLSEGLAVRSVDDNAGRVEYCQERDLPAIRMDPAGYLAQTEPDSLGGIFVDLNDVALAPAAIGDLLGRAWRGLCKGGCLIVETLTPAASRATMPVELLRYLLESQCFTILDVLLSSPPGENLDPVVPASDGKILSFNNYRHYAVVGRK
jgi:hypothetical protein